MKTPCTAPTLARSCLAFLLLLIPSTALAQRELYWDTIEISAHLDALGELRVIETQTMVFTGAWNGGERRFRIRPRQKFFFEGLYRGVNGRWQRLTEDSRLDDVDEYAWADPRTLRWRSRQPSDPPFNSTVLRYELRYALSGILLKEADKYRLDHDFAFPDRSGAIHRFVLRFTHDPVWQPMSEIREVYTAGPLPPGQSFALNLPLHYTGLQVPAVLDLSRPREIVIAVWVLLGLTALAVAWFFVREQSYGRFAPLATEQVNEAWLREHILKYPAEVIGAAWDGSIGTPEVVALIARMVGEGKLESQVEGDGRHSTMTLRLKVDRSTLEAHEGTLVAWLFFDGRTDTSTELVKEHYRDQGFNPVSEIRPELEASVQRLLPEGAAPRTFRLESVILFIFGIGALLFAWLVGVFSPTATILLALIAALVLGGIGWVAGAVFRAQINWGWRAAFVCLAPAMILIAAGAVFLWFYVGTGAIDLPAEALIGIVAVTLALTNASINALRSRQSRGAIALRKTLATGRAFFVSELRKDRPALRDEWFPWALAFGLASAVDDWSVEQSRKNKEVDRQSSTEPTTSPTSSESAASAQWTGFGGGRSGGAGASASWVAAAGGMAAGVSAPRSDTASGGSESDSGVSSSSSGSSSGGGGGGGW